MRRSIVLTRLAIACVLLFGLATDASAGLFQSLRLFPGVYSLSGRSTAGGARRFQIPAVCIDPHLPTPSRWDSFVGASESIKLAQTKGKETVHEITLEQAIREKLAKVYGTDDYTSFSIELLEKAAGDGWQLRVIGLGVVGENKEAVNAAEKKIQPVADSIKRLDSYGSKLRATFGAESPIARRFDDARTTAEWHWDEPKDAERRVANRIKTFPSELSRESKSETTLFLSVLQGRPLTAEEIKGAKDLGFDLEAVAYDPQFVAALKEHSQDLELLIRQFGSQDRFVISFREDFVASFRANADAESALKRSRDGLLEDFGKEPTCLLDILSLVRGERLTPEQAKALTKITKAKIDPPSGILDTTLLIEPIEGARVVLKTTTSSAAVDIGKAKVALQAQLAKTPQVVVDGQLDDRLAGLLSQANVKLVRTLDSLASGPAKEPQNIKLVFVLSKDPKVAAQLFDNRNATEVVKTAKLIEEEKLGVIADTRERLAEALKDLPAGTRPIVVFNAGSKGIMFDDPMDIDELRRLPGNPEGLACNTYQWGDLGFQTTDYIYLRETTKALGEVVKETAGGGGKQPPKVPRGFDGLGAFFERFHGHYNNELRKSGVRRTALVVKGVELLVGAAFGLYLVAQDDKKKDKKPKEDPEDDKPKDEKPKDGDKNSHARQARREAMSEGLLSFPDQFQISPYYGGLPW
jgi:hypothetical protein